MTSLISLLITILIFCLVASVILWVVRLAIAAFAGWRAPGQPIPPFYNLAYAIVVLLLLLIFLSKIGYLGHAYVW